jgi:nitrous oxidase accessory protein
VTKVSGKERWRWESVAALAVAVALFGSIGVIFSDASARMLERPQERGTALAAEPRAPEPKPSRTEAGASAAEGAGAAEPGVPETASSRTEAGEGAAESAGAAEPRVSETASSRTEAGEGAAESAGTARPQEQPLQPLIDRAPAGGTLELPPGTYAGPVVVDKPLRLLGGGRVTIVNSSDRPAIELTADDSALDGMTIVDGQRRGDAAAVLVTGSGNRLTDLQIETQATGILLRGAHRNELTRIRVDSGFSREQTANPYFYMEQGNGIDLRGSHRNTIQESRISGKHDGIYLENSESNRVADNWVGWSRYGYHTMFCHATELIGNRGEANVTGAMVMGEKGTRVVGNIFTKQNENVNSQGLLLYEVQEGVVEGNHLEGNRVGLYVELTSGTRFTGNTVQYNFIGLQMKNAKHNEITRNQWISNVIQAESGQSEDNAVSGNYWDNFRGLDLQGEGRSSLPYRMSPLFFRLTRETPAFQLFFQSPGMMLLETVLQSDPGDWLTDDAPLMQPIAQGMPYRATSPLGLVWLCAGMLFFSGLVIYATGVRKK